VLHFAIKMREFHHVKAILPLMTREQINLRNMVIEIICIIPPSSSPPQAGQTALHLCASPPEIPSRPSTSVSWRDKQVNLLSEEQNESSDFPSHHDDLSLSQLVPLLLEHGADVSIQDKV
jgi:hypothetical protein